MSRGEEAQEECFVQTERDREKRSLGVYKGYRRCGNIFTFPKTKKGDSGNPYIIRFRQSLSAFVKSNKTIKGF